MNFKLFSLFFALALLYSACSTDLLDQVNVEDGVSLRKAAVSAVEWKGDTDKAVAVNIDAVASARKNASGTKITSNAHSADFPGIYFIWDSKQKDNGYLKVDATVFDAYESFTLTSKESNTYWDFVIKIQPGQQKTDDNCYVFFIPKVYNNKNINMVFIDGYVEKTTPIIIEPPIIVEGPCIITYTMISGANDNGIVIDPANNWRLNNEGDPIKTVWNNGISSSPYYNALTGIEANGKKAQWIWDRMDSWEYGFTGSNLINTVSEFVLQGEIVEETVPFYFACDNAAVLFVNGVRVGYTESLEGKPLPASPAIGFTDFSREAFSDIAWQYIAMADIKDFLVQGNNKIVIVAANSDECNGTYNLDNNPAGLIYACQFTTSKCTPEDNDPDPEIEPLGDCIVVFEHMSGNQYGYVGMSYTGNTAPVQLIPLAGPDYTYSIISRVAWPGLNNEEGVKLPVIGTINPVFNVLGNQNVVGQQLLPRAGYYIVEGTHKSTGETITLHIVITPSVQDQSKLGTSIDGSFTCADFQFQEIVVPPVEVNLGFVGFYLNDGNVLSTSIHWQNLKEGDCIDWAAVDAAYDEWVAGGGLAPKRELWQTSGYASYTFDDYAQKCFGDFNLGQLEDYYKNYYVDPGYILPVDEFITPTVVNVGVDCSGLKIVKQNGNNKKDVTIPIVNFMSDGTQELLYTFFKANFNFQNDDTQKYPFIGSDGVKYVLIIKVRNNSINCENVSVEKDTTPAAGKKNNQNQQ